MGRADRKPTAPAPDAVAADEAVPAPPLGDAIARAQQAREKSRAARGRAEVTRSAALAAVAAIRSKH